MSDRRRFNDRERQIEMHVNRDKDRNRVKATIKDRTWTKPSSILIARDGS